MIFILKRIFSLLVISNKELGNQSWFDLVLRDVIGRNEDESVESSSDSSNSP